MAVNSSNALYEQAERIAPKFPYWYSKLDVASNLIKKGENLRISERDLRIPVKTQTGMTFGTYNPNEGSLGRGGYMTGVSMISTFFPLKAAFELPQLAIEATKTSEQAGKNVFREALTDGIPEFTRQVDMAWHAASGNALLGTAVATATVSGNTVYTMDSNFGVKLLRRGMRVNVYDATSVTPRVGNPYMIQSINFGNKKVTLAGTVPGSVATDVFLYEGTSGANPVGLHGLPYFNDFTTSGTTLGIDRALEPEIQSNGVDCTAGLNHQQALLLLHKIYDRRGEMADGLVGLCSTNAQYTIVGEIMNIARYDIDNGNTMKDLLPDVTTKFKFGGVGQMLDNAQNQSRIDFINPKNWGRGELTPLDFYKLPGSGERFFAPYGGDGGIAAGVLFYLCMMADFYCYDPGAEGVLYNIAINTGYN